MSLRLFEAADSLAKASTPEPFSASRTSNWVARGGGLPAYIQHIAHDLMEKRGKSEGNAIQMAIGIVKNWASGQGNVHPETRAAAAKAVAEWEKLKASAHAKSAVKESAPDELDLIAIYNGSVHRLRELSEVLGPEQVGIWALEEAEKSYTAAERKKAKTQPGSDKFPIDNEADLGRAIKAYGRSSSPEATKRWIIRRAKQLNATDKLPDDWNVKEAAQDALRREVGTRCRILEALREEEKLKLKCPKCDTVQAASNSKCVNCGHDLADARKAKMANLKEGELEEGGPYLLPGGGTTSSFSGANSALRSAQAATKKATAAKSKSSSSSSSKTPSGTGFTEGLHARGFHGMFIQMGSGEEHGKMVRGVQKRLGVGADAKFGNVTKQAVINFQKKHGLKVDGVVGTQTASMMAGKKGVKPGALTRANVRFLRRKG